jgi:hypothetical protein
MNNLKEQILNLYQDWYDKNAFISWQSYEEKIQQLTELLRQIYILVKEYKDENQE